MSEISPKFSLFSKHERSGLVSGGAEATEWAWDQAPLPAPQLLVLLAIARHVHVPNLDAFPALLGLDQHAVADAVLDLIAGGFLCASRGGGVHVALDCSCDPT